MNRRITAPKGQINLASLGNTPEEVHLFDDESIIWALNAALAARRPLLIRGEPGIGKTQLARAVAAKEMLNCPLVSYVVDSGTESHDLMWTFDAVHRLAEAQISGTLKDKEPKVKERLDPELFFHPGPLWWAFEWTTALKQATLVGDTPPDTPEGWKAGDGCVVLIDEIDKSESEVPNGLLEALGAGQFHPRGRKLPVKMTGEPPLVIITTNEERILPDAFVRRCLVLEMVLPKDEAILKSLLMERGRAHFGDHTNDDVLELAALLLMNDRRTAKTTPLPGQAEFLDLIRIVVELCPGNFQEQKNTLDHVSRFVLKKHVGAKE